MTIAPPPFATMFAKKADVGLPKSITIMGEPGSRKTTIAGDIMNTQEFTGKRMVYLDVDNGTEAWSAWPEIFQHVDDEVAEDGKTSINIVPIDKTDPAAWDQIQYFLGHLDAQGHFVKGALFNAGYDIIGLDALDVIQEISAGFYLHNTFNDKGKADTRGAYGPIAEWTSGLGWALQNSKEFGLTVMHSKAGADEGGPFKIRPKLVGSSKDSYGGIPSALIYVELRKDKDKKKRTFATVEGDGIIAAKNRFRIEDEIEDFTLVKFFGILADQRAATNATIALAKTPAKAPAAAKPNTAAAAA